MYNKLPYLSKAHNSVEEVFINSLENSRFLIECKIDKRFPYENNITAIILEIKT